MSGILARLRRDNEDLRARLLTANKEIARLRAELFRSEATQAATQLEDVVARFERAGAEAPEIDALRDAADELRDAAAR